MFNIKELIVGIVLIILLGVGGFLYRSVLEQSFPSGLSSGVCTREIKICPDGTSVGRVSPTCAFVLCPPPNILLSNVGIAFVLPRGYASIATSSFSDTSVVAAYVASMAPAANASTTISIRQYPVSKGETAEQVMLRKTIFYPSGLSPVSMQQFATSTIGNHTFQRIEIGNFDGRAQTAYYLPRHNDVLRFDVVRKNAANRIGANLSNASLSGNEALRVLLSTLQVSSITGAR